MARILVTGAAGFIGSNLCERLLHDKHTIAGVDNFDPYYARAIKQNNLLHASASQQFRLIEADIRDAADMRGIFAAFQPDCVVHLAARAGVRPSLERPADYIQTNITGTINILEAARLHRTKHFVLASSSSVYGESAQSPFRETQPTNSPASPYAMTKKAAETAAFTYHQLYGMHTTCLRFFTVYGPRQRPDLAIARFTARIMQNLPITLFGDGSSSRDYTYVSDTVEGIASAVSHPNGYQIYNLGNSAPVSLLQMTRTLADALGRQPQIEWLPSQPGDVSSTCADITLAQNRLGYSPATSFAHGIQKYAEWYCRTQGGVFTTLPSASVTAVVEHRSGFHTRKQPAPSRMSA